ncbi:MAG: hypothetical protein ACKPBA_04600 [Planctomycetota bacterium]
MSRVRSLPVAVAALLAAVLLLAPVLPGCSSGQKKKSQFGEAGKMLRDQRITRAKLEELSNAFADQYFTLMLSASEKVMRDNPDISQRRIMNGLRLLSVSSMYDMATSPDTLTQLVDQLVVVTLQNYFWVDSGRSQAIWGNRAQPLVENLRKARENIWGIAAKVFTDEQLEELDLLIATWWSRRGGTEFVAYVRFSEVASAKGGEILDTVRDGGGLLEPLDRVTDVAEDTRLSVERTFFWAKRVPLFANWQADALMYDILIAPEVQKSLGNYDKVAGTFATMPERVEKIVSRLDDIPNTARSVTDTVFSRALMLGGALFAGLFILIWWRGRNK